MADRRPLPPCDCGHPAHRIDPADLDVVRLIAAGLEMFSPGHAVRLRRLCREYERQGDELAEALHDLDGERDRSDALVSLAQRHVDGCKLITYDDGSRRWHRVVADEDGDAVFLIESMTPAEAEVLAELEARHG